MEAARARTERTLKRLAQYSPVFNFTEEEVNLFLLLRSRLEANGRMWPQPRRMLTRDEREQALRAAELNLFQLSSNDVYIDLLTDSGTGRMSDAQWIALFTGDESYAGSESSWVLGSVIEDIFGFQDFLLVHQGRAAERIAFRHLITPEKRHVLATPPFDTTDHWAKMSGGIVVDCAIPKAYTGAGHPFKGNIEIQKLEQELHDRQGSVACILMTITNNTLGGQPVSIWNIVSASNLAQRYGVPLILDAARFSDNAYYNRDSYSRVRGVSVSMEEMVRITMRYADGVLMSLKKVCGNMGGLMAFRDHAFVESLIPDVIAEEGYVSLRKESRGYGGCAGYTLAALAAGVIESCDEDSLEFTAERVTGHEQLADCLRALGVPAVAGGHGVFVDAGAFLSHIPWEQYPGQALVLELYREEGIRAVEIGSLMHGRDPETGENLRARNERVRLAFPRGVYSEEARQRVISAFGKIAKRKDAIRGVRMTHEGKGIRHFSSTFEWI